MTAPGFVWRHARLLIVGICLLVSACAASPDSALARVAPDSFAPLVKKVLPAVVNIAVTETLTGNDFLADLPPELRGTPFERQFRERFRNRREQMMGAGSGFIIDPSGIIVTNNHVVGHAEKIVVSLSDGTELPARVIGVDELTDIAVIKVISNRSLPYVVWGDSRQVEVGDWILACGNPFGLGGSVTAGIVSARGRDIGAGPFDDFLQLDAPINPGNSGGPTFNLQGEVVAINTAIVSPTGGSVGIGFAIPSEIVQKIVADLRNKGHIDRGWLGVSVQDVPGDAGGVAIASIERNGPAAKSGVRPGDMVTAVNGEKVDSARGLIRAVAAVPPGGSVHLSVRRAGREVDIPVTVGQRPNTTDG
ncbi:MAG: trypsin-like peptidase domain-containing protein [Acetobacteraceae bacterium]|nr:trypsin-like peptidase domain-containing protein [Acetobacteraceae bacterium]